MYHWRHGVGRTYYLVRAHQCLQGDDMRTCVDVVIDDEVGRVEVLDDKVPPLLPSDELAPPRLSDHLGQLPDWKVGVRCSLIDC